MTLEKLKIGLLIVSEKISNNKIYQGKLRCLTVTVILNYDHSRQAVCVAQNKDQLKTKSSETSQAGWRILF
jgi:hypothetical protein